MPTMDFSVIRQAMQRRGFTVPDSQSGSVGVSRTPGTDMMQGQAPAPTVPDSVTQSTNQVGTPTSAEEIAVKALGDYLKQKAKGNAPAGALPQL